MTQPLDKASLVRSAWLTELRRQGHRQCVGLGSGEKGCALQMLARMRDGQDDDLLEAAELAGLSRSQAWQVMALNDGETHQVVGTKMHPEPFTVSADRQHTFAEIADVVEGWFKCT